MAPDRSLTFLQRVFLWLKLTHSEQIKSIFWTDKNHVTDGGNGNAVLLREDQLAILEREKFQTFSYNFRGNSSGFCFNWANNWGVTLQSQPVTARGKLELTVGIWKVNPHMDRVGVFLCFTSFQMEWNNFWYLYSRRYWPPVKYEDVEILLSQR